MGEDRIKNNIENTMKKVILIKTETNKIENMKLETDKIQYIKVEAGKIDGLQASVQAPVAAPINVDDLKWHIGRIKQVADVVRADNQQLMDYELEKMDVVTLREELKEEVARNQVVPVVPAPHVSLEDLFAEEPGLSAGQQLETCAPFGRVQALC